MICSELRIAEDAARAGGAIVARYFREGVTIRSKESYNLVSDADIDSEKAIADVIHRNFPNHAVLGEEINQADVGSEHLWIVDPLDGTNNFAHRVEQFAVSIAYFRRGRPVCGVVHHPLRDDWYTAVRGAGASLNGRALHVERSSRLEEVLVGVGFYYDRGAMMEATLAAIGDLFRAKIHGIRRFGAASLDLCHVADGQFGAFFEYELAPWDFAAGALIVEEAGGMVSTCRGAPLSLDKTSLLATNGALHESMLSVVKARHP
jgi:myo-inositol-1(or 4)-monophosphatase